MPRTGGRKTILTDDMMAALERNLGAGVSIKDACAMVGISVATYMQWQAKGVDEQEAREQGQRPNARNDIYIQFIERATKARATGRVRAIATINRAITDYEQNPELATRNAQWLLERSDPQEWGRQVRTVQHEGNVTVSWDGIIGRMSDALTGADDDDVDPIGD